MNSAGAHKTVLLDEAVEAMNIQPDGCYIDGTFGRGGHSAAILQRLGPQGRLLALDRDPQAVRHAHAQFAEEQRFSIYQRAISELQQVTDEAGLTGRVAGLLLDLGVSSPQLDDATRGFSFQHDGPLDMRMDTTRGQSAADWLATADESEIALVLKEYGEERFARRIARAIVAERQLKPILTTGQLAALISKANPSKERKKHPATRSFQAIRIYINRELDELQACLRQSLKVLAGGARLVVISFHSLEDRIVKRFMKDLASPEKLPKGLPVPESERKPGILKLVGKAVKPSAAEIEENPRARSAVMRIAEVRL